MFASVVDDVLGRTVEFQHFVITGRFEPAGFELVADFHFQVVFGLVLEVVLEFDDEFHGFAEPIHDQLLRTEGFDLGNLEPFFLFGQFREHVPAFTLETDFLDLAFLFAFRSQDFREETLFAVGPGPGLDDFKHTVCDVGLKPVVFDEHGLVDLLQVTDFEA